MSRTTQKRIGYHGWRTNQRPSRAKSWAPIEPREPGAGIIATSEQRREG